MTMDKRWDAAIGSWKLETLEPLQEFMRERESNRFSFKDYAERGPVGRETDINSVDEYERMFGSIKDHLQVRAALAQGCTVTFERMILRTARKASFHNYRINDLVFSIEAVDEGKWGNLVDIAIDTKGKYGISIVVKYEPQRIVQEHFLGISTNKDDPRFLVTYINNRSRLIRIKEGAEIAWAIDDYSTEITLDGGSD